MAKGDGKKRRPKQQTTTDSSSSSSSSTSNSNTNTPPPPQRVVSNSIIPVRRQIQYAKMKKEYEKAMSAPTAFRSKNVKTAYRKKLDPTEEEEKKLLRQKRGQNPDWDVILNTTVASPLLIVDAYNVIHSWPRLKKHLMKGQSSKARQLLIEDCEELQRLKGWRIEIVFDGAGRSTTGPLGDAPGASLSREQNNNNNNGGDSFDDSVSSSSATTSPKQRISTSDQQSKASVTDHGVRVVYSGVGNSADSYIESRCAAAKKVTDGKITGSLIVASNDNMVRVAGQSAGAFCMSSDHFVNELKAIRMATKYRVEAAVAKANGQSMRPVGTTTKSNTPQSILFQRKNQFIIEDKRQQRKKNKQSNDNDNHNNNNQKNDSVDHDSLSSSSSSPSETKDTNINEKVNNTSVPSSSKDNSNNNDDNKNDTNANSSIPSWAMIPDNSYHSKR